MLPSLQHLSVLHVVDGLAQTLEHVGSVHMSSSAPYHQAVSAAETTSHQTDCCSRDMSPGSAARTSYTQQYIIIITIVITTAGAIVIIIIITNIINIIYYYTLQQKLSCVTRQHTTSRWLTQCVLASGGCTRTILGSILAQLSNQTQNYKHACFQINFSERKEGSTSSSIICDHW